MAADAVLQLVDLRRRLLDWLANEIGNWSVTPLHASLFGSAARGDGGTASDLDLLLIRADQAPEEAWDQQLYESGQRVLRAAGNAAAWMSVTVSDLRRMALSYDPIIDEWKRDGILLTGHRLPDVLERVQ